MTKKQRIEILEQRTHRIESELSSLKESINELYMHSTIVNKAINDIKQEIKNGKKQQTP